MPNTFRPRDIVLSPGQHAVDGSGVRMRTLLGSCVSIVLWHRVKQVGAMSHFILATRGSPREGPLDGRYGDEAMELMLSKLNRRGIQPSQCEAKVFGGGNMFPTRLDAGVLNVGKRNGEAARTLLEARGIPIVCESLFGTGHRQIVFDVGDGDVWVRIAHAPAEMESQ